MEWVALWFEGAGEGANCEGLNEEDLKKKKKKEEAIEEEHPPLLLLLSHRSLEAVAATKGTFRIDKFRKL